ncbi:hypothetical protein NM208_g1768 [Fusarium decemcellulare]|uniref:Uncharacterized protein n=1 Tax=Fusarium decemcellulare TaxID=57161 RepID=A0ACC1SUU0_9HYPO|nr:hypothetical protein NM208_g1768 [Fusarium decemcellulare]
MAGHKLTPVLMIGSLLLGVMFAVGHHLYYEFLDGNIVKSQSQQEWFLRVGTGVAFSARAMLSAAVGFAYTQILWRTLRLKSVTIQGMNSFFGILHNTWDFTAWEIWTAAPALAVVAIIAWFLPLIAVITPATLTVQVSSHPNTTVIQAPIPIMDYDNTLNFAQWTTAGAVGFSAPSSYISRIVLSVASLGSILTIPAPFPNSSYSVDFYGPTISCGTLKNASFAQLVNEAIENSTCCGNSVGYVGFVPSSRLGNSFLTYNATEEEYALAGLQGALNYSLVSDMASFDQTAKNTSTAKFYVAVPVSPLSAGYVMANKTIECQLYNSSFAINFTFTNGQQDISYESKRLNEVSTTNAMNCQDLNPSRCTSVIAYVSLIDALGKLLLGSLQITHYGAISPIQTQVMSSVLMDFKEMQTLRTVNMQSLSDHSKTPASVIRNASMADALEQIFTNATISLFSNSNFLQNDTAASQGPITYLSPQNAFSYEPHNLFIAYGLGILVSTTIIIVGLLCIKSASASYESSLSTILRTTRNPELDAMIPAAETSGANPLSNQLRNVRLSLRRQGLRAEGINEEMLTFFAVDSTPEKTRGVERVAPIDPLLQQNGCHQSLCVGIDSWNKDEYTALRAN